MFIHWETLNRRFGILIFSLYYVSIILVCIALLVWRKAIQSNQVYDGLCVIQKVIQHFIHL
jgi:hypothetical protein